MDKVRGGRVDGHSARVLLIRGHRQRMVRRVWRKPLRRYGRLGYAIVRWIRRRLSVRGNGWKSVRRHGRLRRQSVRRVWRNGEPVRRLWRDGRGVFLFRGFRFCVSMGRLCFGVLIVRIIGVVSALEGPATQAPGLTFLKSFTKKLPIFQKDLNAVHRLSIEISMRLPSRISTKHPALLPKMLVNLNIIINQ